MDELNEEIRKLKRGRAPGPDGIPTEVLKEMDEERREEIREI